MTRTAFSLDELVRIGAEVNAQEFDHPFILNPDGTITDAPSGVYAPEAYNGVYAPDAPHDVYIPESDSWECAAYRMSGQHDYRGGVMHQSEYIGAGIARLLLSDEPQTYCVVEVRDDDGQFPGGDPICWPIVRYKTKDG